MRRLRSRLSGRSRRAAVDISVRGGYIGPVSDSHANDKLDYAKAGVDLKAGQDAVERIKALARKTFGAGVLSEIGAFGGFFKPDLAGLASPVLVSSADGVGTKLKLAFMTGRHDTVGEDLVNHCVNDILVHGARALFFLDYIATGRLEPSIVTKVVEGLSRGCQANGVALLGGETAEMPGFYRLNEYDLAGFIVGVVDEKKIVSGATIAEGDVCIGLPSNGLHTNGYTLARKIVFDVAGLKPDDVVDELGASVAEALMKVHTCYAGVIHPLLDLVDVHGMAHITGGGIPGNLRRVIPDGLSAEIVRDGWPVPPVFEFLMRAGNVSLDEMYSVFNMGIGFKLVAAARDADKIKAAVFAAGATAFPIGRIVTGDDKVRLVKP